MDKGLEFVQIVEHGVKFEDKSDHDIGDCSKYMHVSNSKLMLSLLDVFGAKIERQNGHKVGYGDSMRADTDDDDDRRKKRQSENQQQGGGDFEKEIKEVEGAWSQMWSKVVESAKQMWKKVSTKFGADGQQQQGQGGQQGQQGPQGQPGQRGQEEQF